ncbi:MAG: YdcF family protein [Rubrivivax sp.]|nr:YdcF family protein [Rubrivivax sp.]
MNEIVTGWGLHGLKHLLTVLVLPPVPFLILMLVGARLMFHRRLLAWLLVLLAVLGLWFSHTTVLSRALMPWLLGQPMPLTASQIKDLDRSAKMAIVVLGGGRWLLAPEYGVSSLQARTLERLRYGLWLGRQTSLPVAFSGGLSPGAPAGATEAEIAARIAEREFRQPLRWIEDQSKDTRENASLSVALLLDQGIERIVVVTHAYHMPRALAHFENAVLARSAAMQIVPAPMGWIERRNLDISDWLPSMQGQQENWLILRESLGRLAGG